MSADQRYPIPAGACRTEEKIKRSRFITTLDYTPSVADARGVIDRVRAEFSDASHNCWAYLIGPPGNTGTVGMSDDGEPHGTAGRPMLTVLTHCGVGDLTAVVTRYFGGTKLGKGGLVRAYSGGVQQALEHLILAEHILCVTLLVVIGYTNVTLFQRLLPGYETAVESETYGADVEYRVRLPEEQVAPFRKALGNLTHGEALVEIAETK